MLNNKGYVFLPVIILFIMLIAVSSFSFKEGITNSINKGSVIEGMMDKCYYNYTKFLISYIDNKKELTYSNLSKSSFVKNYNNSIGGIIVNNNPTIPFAVPSFNCTARELNISFPPKSRKVTFSYAIRDILEANSSFKKEDIQTCISNGDCNNSNLEEILINCIQGRVYNSFQLRNCSVPVQQGNRIYVNLCLVNDGMTLIYPFQIGLFSFSC